jgi:hypothetical protein
MQHFLKLQCLLLPKLFFIVVSLVLLPFFPINIATAAENTQLTNTISSKVGTGFAINKNGYILTVSHVILDTSDIVVYSNLYPKGIPANLVKIDRTLDLALLKINEPTQPLSIAKWPSVPNGLLIFSLGYPTPEILGKELKITSGLINALEGIDKKPGLFQFSAPIQKGNSGGPIVSPDVNVIGITQGKFESDTRQKSDTLQNVNLAIQSKIIEDFLSSSQVEFTLKTFNPDTLKPSQTVYTDSERSIFLVISTDTNSQKTNKTFSVDENIRKLLATLAKDGQPKLFGAYKVGFDKLLDIGREQLLIKSSSISQIPGNSQVVKFDSILSLSKARLYDGQQNYSSIIMSSQYDCVNQAIMITRKEYKEDVFGTGKTIVALLKKEGVPDEFKPFKSENINTFILRTVCDNLPIIVKEDINQVPNSAIASQAKNSNSNASNAMTNHTGDSNEPAKKVGINLAEKILPNVASLAIPKNTAFNFQVSPAEPIKSLDVSNAENNMTKETLKLEVIQETSAKEPSQITDETSEREILMSLIRDWQTAWSKKDIQKYISMYSPSYGIDTLTHQNWVKQRTQRITNRTKIDIQIEDIKIVKQGNKFVCSFIQTYTSDSFKEKSRKILEWEKYVSSEKNDGRHQLIDHWVIVRETSHALD